MAKSKKVVSKKPLPSRKRKAPRRMPFADPKVQAYIRTLSDPCNAPLTHGVYPGQVGFISRMSQVYTFSLTASQTAFILAVNPTSAISLLTGAADTVAPISPTFLNTYVPGSTFLTASARSTRALGACIQFFTNAAPLNAQGTYVYGVVPQSVISNGAANIGAVLPSLQHMSKVNADAYEVKWRPGGKDEFYATPNTNVASTEWDDTNAMCVCGTGFPVSSSITVRITIIYEWLPATNLGLSTPTASNASIHRPGEVLAHMDEKHSHWWAGKMGDATEFLWSHGGKQFASFATQMAARGAARGLLQYAGSAAPLLLA